MRVHSGIFEPFNSNKRVKVRLSIPFGTVLSEFAPLEGKAGLTIIIPGHPEWPLSAGARTGSDTALSAARSVYLAARRCSRGAHRRLDRKTYTGMNGASVPRRFANTLPKLAAGHSGTC